jgi:hypothetical protein
VAHRFFQGTSHSLCIPFYAPKGWAHPTHLGVGPTCCSQRVPPHRSHHTESTPTEGEGHNGFRMWSHGSFTDLGGRSPPKRLHANRTTKKRRRARLCRRSLP